MGRGGGGGGACDGAWPHVSSGFDWGQQGQWVGEEEIESEDPAGARRGWMGRGAGGDEGQESGQQGSSDSPDGDSEAGAAGPLMGAHALGLGARGARRPGRGGEGRGTHGGSAGGRGAGGRGARAGVGPGTTGTGWVKPRARKRRAPAVPPAARPGHAPAAGSAARLEGVSGFSGSTSEEAFAQLHRAALATGLLPLAAHGGLPGVGQLAAGAPLLGFAATGTGFASLLSLPLLMAAQPGLASSALPALPPLGRGVPVPGLAVQPLAPGAVGPRTGLGPGAGAAGLPLGAGPFFIGDLQMAPAAGAAAGSAVASPVAAGAVTMPALLPPALMAAIATAAARGDQSFLAYYQQLMSGGIGVGTGLPTATAAAAAPLLPPAPPSSLAAEAPGAGCGAAPPAVHKRSRVYKAASADAVLASFADAAPASSADTRSTSRRKMGAPRRASLA
jgi:hypothetical protein